MQSYDQKNINANTATFECLCKSSGVDTALALMTQIKWTLSKNCVYTAVEGMKEMGFIHGEKIHLSKFLPLPSELRSQMLEFHGIDPRIISYPREKIEITHPAPPSPSLGFISSPNLDFGGVSLSKTAELQLNLADITGAAFDPITGQLVLFGPEDRYFPPIDLDDLAVAVRSVYSIGLPCPQDPGVSIGTESSPFAGQMKVRYDGATANTSFGQIMFEADRLLKCLELGKDNISGQAVSANVPGYSSLINRLAAHQFFSQTAVGHRMWFVPDKITLVEAEDHKGMVFSDVRMKVLTESQFNGSPSDVPACREFAEHFTAHFDEFSKQYPILEKLKTLGKITAIVKWIRENNIPFDPSFFINYQPKKIETVAYTPSTESRGEWMVEKTEKHKVPGHKKKKKVAVPYTYSFSASGGVDYRLNSSNFATYVDPLVNDFSISALRSRPSEQDFTWTFRSPTNRETFMAAAQSISRTRKPGNVKKSYVDMNFPVPGNQELTLYRFYNSFSEKEAALGRGWRIVPYELEISLEKVILSSQDDKSCETRRAILVRTPDAECFFQPFALSSDNCPVFNSPDYSGLLKDNLNGTFSFYIPRFGRVDFDKGGRLIRTLDTNGFSIEYRYRGDQLVSICHQNGATILLEYEENRLFKAIGPGNTSVYYTYHPDGQLKTVDDVSGPYLRYSYDLDQRLSKITDRLENILFEAAYDDYNRATLIKEGGISYQADFSLEKRVMKVYDHQGRESILKYDEKDKLIYRQDPGGLIWEFEYEQVHVPFPTKIIDPKKGITKCHYDPAGNPIYLKNSAGAEWRFFYDLAGKLVARREPNKRTIWNWYFGVNQQLSQNYANTYLEFDENNLFAQIYTGIQIKGPATYFNYDKITGQLKSRKDTRGGTTSFDYDDHGQLKEISYPMGYVVERKVDEKGKIHEISDGFGLQKSYDYDESGQLKEVRTPLGTTHFTYD